MSAHSVRAMKNWWALACRLQPLWILNLSGAFLFFNKTMSKGRLFCWKHCFFPPLPPWESDSCSTQCWKAPHARNKKISNMWGDSKRKSALKKYYLTFTQRCVTNKRFVFFSTFPCWKVINNDWCHEKKNPFFCHSNYIVSVGERLCISLADDPAAEKKL